MNNLLAETALNVLLRLIIQTHFQNVKCLMQSTSNQTHTNLRLPILFDSYISYVINPPHCISGCSDYILHDPDEKRTSWIDECLLNNGEYKFTAIIVLELQSIEMYAKKTYAGDAIFITFQDKDYFTIGAFGDWEVTQPVVLNRWCIKSNRFLLSRYNVKDFFNGKWKYSNKPFVLPTDLKMPVYYKSEYVEDIVNASGSDYHVLNEFAIAKKFAIETSKHVNDDDDETIFEVSNDGKYKNGVIYSYPMTGIEFTFMVPNPKIYIYWLQLLKVFKPTLWILIILAYFCIGAYFWILRKIEGDQPSPRFWSIISYFIMQSFNLVEIPVKVIPRVVFTLPLFLGLIYASLFSSGIVAKTIYPSYENLILTIEDLANSNLYIAHDSDVAIIFAKSDLETTESEQIILSNERNANNSLNDEDLVAFFVMRSEYKSNTFLADTHIEMAESLARTYSKYELVSNNTVYVHLVPKLNHFMLWCKEAGLHLRWEWEYQLLAYSAVPLREHGGYRVSYDVDRIILSLEHLRAAFIFWLVGITLSVLGFGIEHLMSILWLKLE